MNAIASLTAHLKHLSQLNTPCDISKAVTACDIKSDDSVVCFHSKGQKVHFAEAYVPGLIFVVFWPPSPTSCSAVLLPRRPLPRFLPAAS